MTVRFEIVFDDVSKLSERIRQLGEKSEETINESLRKHGKNLIVPKITSLIKTSFRQEKGIREKVHANKSNWSRIIRGNLSLTIATKKNFNYLVFPNQGIGKHNLVEQGFMERGLENGIGDLTTQIEQDLIQAIEEEL